MNVCKPKEAICAARIAGRWNPPVDSTFAACDTWHTYEALQELKCHENFGTFLYNAPITNIFIKNMRLVIVLLLIFNCCDGQQYNMAAAYVIYLYCSICILTY